MDGIQQFRSSDASSPISRNTTAARGFTLIELLVVIAVITLLASLVAPNVIRHMGGARDSTARAQIEMMAAALDAYRLDAGSYPSTEDGLAALWQAPDDDLRWNGPYLRKAPPLDPWGNAYVYRSPASESSWGYDLASLGADGAVGGEGDDADIRGWE
jgi:general secretion pathway protein G